MTGSEERLGWQVRTLKGHWCWVLKVAFSPDGKRVVSGSNDSYVKIWGAATGAEVSSFVGVRCVETMGAFCGFSLFPAFPPLKVVSREGGLAGVPADRAWLEDCWTRLT